MATSRAKAVAKVIGESRARAFAESTARSIAGELKPSFEEILKKTHEASFRLAMKIIGDVDSVGDVLQDAYMNVFRSLERFRGESKYETWVYRIVLNAAMGHLRKKIRQRNLELPVDSLSAEPEDKSAASSFENRANTIDVIRLLALVPESTRELLVTRYIMGLSVREIAEHSGTSEATVKVRLYRARRRVAELVELDRQSSESDPENAQLVEKTRI